MNSGSCGNYCVNGFRIITKDPRLNSKNYRTSSSEFTNLKSTLVVTNETNFNQNKKHNSYARYLLRKKGHHIKCQNC